MEQVCDIVSRITERSGQLRLAEQKVAAAILNDLSTAASASIGELAQRAGVSLASVTRFAKAMGCRDVREFKFMLAQAVAVGQRFFDGVKAIPSSQPPELADVVYNDIHAVLEVNRALLNQDALHRAAELLRDARMIYSFGMGGGSTHDVGRSTLSPGASGATGGDIPRRLVATHGGRYAGQERRLAGVFHHRQRAGIADQLRSRQGVWRQDDRHHCARFVVGQHGGRAADDQGAGNGFHFQTIVIALCHDDDARHAGAGTGLAAKRSQSRAVATSQICTRYASRRL